MLSDDMFSRSLGTSILTLGSYPWPQVYQLLSSSALLKVLLEPLFRTYSLGSIQWTLINIWYSNHVIFDVFKIVLDVLERQAMLTYSLVS